MLRKPLVFILVLISSLLYGQSCGINSDSIVCLNELINFSPSTSGTILSVKWEFGDGSSSTQNSVLHAYSTIGSKQVKLTITYSDGTSCFSQKKVMVHDLPTADFALNDRHQCLSTHELCLEDQSDMGQTTNGYSKRIILWGDGGSDQSFSPSVGDDICYTSYPNEGTYPLTVEVENDKGCEDIWQDEIVILKDYLPSFTTVSYSAGCTSQRICANNDSMVQPSDIDHFEWDFGDGTTSSASWLSQCHTYNNPGTYTVSLTVTLKNGCVTTYTQQVKLNFVKVAAEVNLNDSVMCFPGPFSASAKKIPGAIYIWELRDSNHTPIKVFSYNIVSSVQVPYPGDFYIRLRVKRADCEDESEDILIRALGVKADFDPLNRNQCALEDTVYFYNKSKEHPSAIAEYTWDFDDENADSCTGTHNNCNFDSLFHSKHWYTDTGCYYPKLYVIDKFSGCVDTTERMVSIQSPTYADFSYKLEKPCVGGKPDYSVRFRHKLCLADISAKYDSCEVWKKFAATVNYDSTCSEDGWISVEFAVRAGDTVVYRSADPTDYYIDLRKMCFDTIKRPKWFQLHQEPEAEFDVKREHCLPAEIELKYTGKDSLTLKYIDIDWSDEKENFVLNGGSIQKFYHTYYEEGSKGIAVIVTDSFGCYNAFGHNEELGYFNDFYFDSILCVGDEVLFTDSIRYWADPEDYWRHLGNAEQIFWNFGDGKGYSDTGAMPIYHYANKGKYKIEMASVDADGCTDTASHFIYVGGINADFKKGVREFLCDQITQFFDSSYHDFPELADTVVEYKWWFGDGSIESFLRDPYHYYNKNGFHKITHVVETESGCTDTVSFDIYLDGPRPSFEIITDSIGCVPHKVLFKSNSYRTSNFVWHFGDSANTTLSTYKDTTVEFTYPDPGIYYVYLEGADSFYNTSTDNYYSCRAIYPDSTVPNPILKRVIVLPYPEVDLSLQDPICINKPFDVWSLSDTIYDTFHWYLDGQELFGVDDTVSLSIGEGGRHTIELKPTYVLDNPYKRACYDSASLTFVVTDLKADFSIERLGNCNEFQFWDSSFNANEYSWDFDHLGNSSSDQHPIYSYGTDTGTYNICLEITSTDGCVDTACKDLKSSYYELAEMYNIITPRGDQLNDELIVDMYNQDFYHLEIFNRWGEMVFESRDPAYSWNGQYMNQGIDLPNSVYFYVLKYSFECTDEEFEKHGTVTLVWE
ncbi:MAG: PKD domain-containing protein [Bacteroidia bacterium]